MKFVIQRVIRGCVRVGGNVVGEIGRGLMVLVGISQKDTDEYFDHCIDKLLNIRLFDDEKGARWKESVKSLGLDLLLVSQFTLYHILKGNKPDFHFAMDGDKARELFDKFVARAREKYDEKKIQTGAFGEYMQIELLNDGPVTIEWEYPTENVEKSNAAKMANKSLHEPKNKRGPNPEKDKKKEDEKDDKKEDTKEENPEKNNGKENKKEKNKEKNQGKNQGQKGKGKEKHKKEKESKEEEKKVEGLIPEDKKENENGEGNNKELAKEGEKEKKDENHEVEIKKEDFIKEGKKDENKDKKEEN